MILVIVENGKRKEVTVNTTLREHDEIKKINGKWFIIKRQDTKGGYYEDC
ncbi:MAG: hypothetical protein ACRCX2_10115 [Paraclostridium sp.]